MVDLRRGELVGCLVSVAAAAAAVAKDQGLTSRQSPTSQVSAHFTTNPR